MSSGEFPEPPTGSPGGVRGAARAIGRAGESLADVGVGLKGASGALAADWHGWAASSYQSCVTGLAGPVRVGADQFSACEKAVMTFADSLERAQDEIKRLHGLWVDAKAREAAALSQYSALSTQLATAKPKEAPAIEDSLRGASSAADTAGGEAAQLVIKANEVLEEFKADAAAQADVLSGANPFTPGIGLGAGAGIFSGAGSALSFGVPSGGLDPLRGVITVQHPTGRVAKGPGEYLLGGGPFGGDYKSEETSYKSTNIPGYTNFYDRAFGHHDALKEDHSLINPVEGAAFLIAAPLAKPLLQGGRAALGGAADDLVRGFALTKGERDRLLDIAALGARKEGAAILAPTTRHRTDAIEAMVRTAMAKEEIRINAAQGDLAKNIADVIGKAGADLPPGTGEILGNLIANRTGSRFATAGILTRVQAKLAEANSSRANRAAEALDPLIKRLQR